MGREKWWRVRMEERKNKKKRKKERRKKKKEKKITYVPSVRDSWRKFQAGIGNVENGKMH